MTNKKEIGREAKWVRWLRGNEYRPDTHIIKERIHYDDGSTEPNLKTIKNYERPFYITKPPYRNHKQNKEREHVDKLTKHMSTQTDLRNNVAIALGKRYVRGSLKQLSTDPYLYGSDTSSCAIIKQQYKDKYGELSSMNDVVTFDIETDVLGPENRIIVESASSSKKIVVSILKDFLGDITNPKEKLQSLLDEYLGEYITKRGMEVEFSIFEEEEDVISYPIYCIHKWKPDFLSIWNQN